MRIANYVILLVIDDLRADQFNALLKEGKLPNIKEFLTNGIISDCTGCFPAITYPAQSTLLTGVYPDAYTPPGGHWVKRDKKLIRNYNTFEEFTVINEELGPVNTIFELIPGNTAGLSIGLNRGCSQIYPTKLQVVRLFLWYMKILRKKMIFLNTLLLKKLLDYFNKPRKFFRNAEPPRLTVSWFLTTDDALHHHGAESEEYLHTLRDIDTKIGELIKGRGKNKGLKELGYLDDTVIMLTSDHGNYKANKWVDIAPYLNQIGLIPLIPKKQEGNFDATMGSLCFFSLRGETWLERPTIQQMQHYGPNQVNLFDAILDIPGAKYLYYREDGNTFEKGLIHVLKKEDDKKSSTFIEYRNDETKVGTDLFGYSKDETATKMLDGKFHSIDEWLEHTHHVDFPMVIDQVARLFRNPNSCDIMMSTCGETIFNYEHGKTKHDHIHGHDIGRKSALTVPLLISGSQIPSKTLPYSKSTDIVPTILKLLGEPIPPNLVGKPLI